MADPGQDNNEILPKLKPEEDGSGVEEAPKGFEKPNVDNNKNPSVEPHVGPELTHDPVPNPKPEPDRGSEPDSDPAPRAEHESNSDTEPDSDPEIEPDIESGHDSKSESEPKPRGLFSDINDSLFGDPWEMWIGAILISILSILLFIIASPLGSIGGINNYGQNAYNFLGYSFDEAGTGGIACPADFLYAMLILSVFLGAVGAAMFSKEFAIRIAPKPELVKGLVGGLLMGVGGSIGMGCTISGFYSSLPALSAGGLFFGMGLFIGVFVALKYFLWESERFPSLSEGKWGKVPLG